MKIENRETFTDWRWDTIYPLPSVSIAVDRGLISNYDTGRIQEFIDFEIYFNFLWFTAFTYPILMWGDKGEIKTKEAVYECSYCLTLNTDESDEISSGKCFNCGEIDYWEFKGYAK
jgi:hypothetical protein